MRDLDTQALVAMYGGAHGRWVPAMIALTWLGSGWVSLALLPLIGWPRTRRFAATLAIAITAQATCVWALKLAVGRVRPWIAMGLGAPIGAPHDGSFPSGHASGSFCVAAFLVVSLPSLRPAWPAGGWRVRLCAAAILAIASLIGVSRVYLGAHFPGDVFAGALTGACFGALAGERYVSRRRPPAPRAEPAVAVEASVR